MQFMSTYTQRRIGEAWEVRRSTLVTLQPYQQQTLDITKAIARALHARVCRPYKLAGVLLQRSELRPKNSLRLNWRRIHIEICAFVRNIDAG